MEKRPGTGVLSEVWNRLHRPEDTPSLDDLLAGITVRSLLST